MRNPFYKVTHILITILISSVMFGCRAMFIDSGTPDTESTEQPSLPEIGAIKTVRFVALGDTGTGSAQQLKIAKVMQQRCNTHRCDFALLLGDNFYDKGVDSLDDPQLKTKFEIPYAPLGIPFYAVLGNHDYGNKGLDYKRSLVQLEYEKHSSSWKMPHHYYQFHVRNASFYAFDTNAQFFKLDKEQRKNIKTWINDSSSKWKIAFGHHPYKSNGPHGNAGAYEDIDVPIVSGDGVRNFARDIWCGKVDLYISGHDHSRQWLDVQCDGTYLAVSGAGAKTTQLTERNPYLFQHDSIGFLYVILSDLQLQAFFY